MSKRSDDTDAPELEEGMTTAERRRRRRRGAGLRVPSDNVPRRSSSHPVVAPVPEDPNLAVSIAYSFGNDASQPVPRAAPVDVGLAPADAGRSASLDEADGPDEFAEPEDVPIRARTDSGVIAIGQPGTGVPSTPAAAAARALDPGALDVVADGRTREMPAIQLEALGLEVPRDDGDDDAAEPTAATEIPRPPVEAPAHEAAAEEPAAAPRGPITQPRAATMALSDDDLEELVDSGALPAPGAAAARALPTVTFVTDAAAPAAAPAPSSEADVDIDVADRATTEPRGDVSGELSVAAPVATPPVVEPGVVTDLAASAESEDIALDDADLQDEVVSPGDASDSGEILSDELIEEVEAQAAAAVPLRAVTGEEIGRAHV